MIITVTLNPAIDRTISVEGCQLGSVHRVQQTDLDVGGKGINVSKVIHLLGGQTLATGFIGGTNGQKIKTYLQSQNITEKFIDISEETRTNIKIYDQSTKVTTEFNEKGPEVGEKYIKELEELIFKKAKKAEYVVFSGSISKNFDLDKYQHMISSASKKSKTVIDADGELLKKGLETSPYLIKPNIDELIHTFDLKIESRRDIIQTCRHIMNQYKVQVILVSMGKEGSMLITQENVYEVLPIKVEVKSTVGAGDSMLGGFLYGLSKNPTNLVEALRYGTASGTAAVTTEGTKLFSLDVFESLLNQVSINKIE